MLSKISRICKEEEKRRLIFKVMYYKVESKFLENEKELLKLKNV